MVLSGKLTARPQSRPVAAAGQPLLPPRGRYSAPRAGPWPALGRSRTPGPSPRGPQPALGCTGPPGSELPGGQTHSRLTGPRPQPRAGWQGGAGPARPRPERQTQPSPGGGPCCPPSSRLRGPWWPWSAMCSRFQPGPCPSHLKNPALP